MDMKVTADGHVQVIALVGRFDAFETAQIVKWFEVNVTDQQKHVVVDLSGVGFLDSAALASLVKGMKRCRERGGDLVLCNMQQAVRIIFELTGLDKAFKIVETKEGAVSAFAA
ncbi:MAG: STAS domain-containing protein [Chloroflexi bacterium]|nr:STAS domain-containing protein [Chloroflexota bacterium]